MFDQRTLDRELQTALTLKADDLYFTLGGDLGRELQAKFLGVAPFEGLACEAFDDTNVAEIDLSHFDIARQVCDLATVVSGRRWGPNNSIPDTELQRVDNLEFLEHFISTLPSVALGGFDATHVREGALKKLYLTSLAWFDLVDAVAGAFSGGSDLHGVELSQLALLSGRDLRTIRNHAGPSKALRTTAERHRRRTNDISAPAFVMVHTFDAVDWLRRRHFEFAEINIEWARQRVGETSERTTTARSLIMLALINFGSRNVIATQLGSNEDYIRKLEDGLTLLTDDDERQLRSALGI